jgi:predicted GNAT family acetyltransferase
MMAAFDVRAFPDPAAFVRDVAGPMAADAIANNVFLIVADQMAAEPEPGQLRYGVFADGVCVLAAWMTPPHRLGLAGSGDAAAKALAAHLAGQTFTLPGVAGPKGLTDAFADVWRGFAGQRSEFRSRDDNFYQITQINAPPGVEGTMRLAAQGERDLLCHWMVAFSKDTGLPASEGIWDFAAHRVDRALAQDCAYVWEAEGLPAGCAIERPFRSAGARVTSVFTDRGLRGRGYAGALTAALSQKILESGRWCVLFADADNPLTNRLYQRLGYRLQAVYSDIHFVPG